MPSSTLLENVMRKPREFDGELKALQDKARDLNSRKVQQLGELVIATGADSLGVDELAGALIVLTETKDAGTREARARRGAAFCARLASSRCMMKPLRSQPKRPNCANRPAATKRGSIGSRHSRPSRRYFSKDSKSCSS
jgi:hypothetical protein